jgi:Ser/Thr protein kinase RdoA (MazF antagonist)
MGRNSTDMGPPGIPANGAPARDAPDDVLDAPTRPLPRERVAALVSERFGLEGTFDPLPGERDQNLRLTVPGVRRFVVKISNPAEDPSVVDFQDAALRHIAAADPGLPVPRPVPAADGRSVIRVDDGTGAERTLRVLTYLEGVPLHRVPPSPAQHAALGRIAGRLLSALEGLRHPADGHVLLWDLARAADVRGRLASVDVTRRGRIARILDRFADEIAPRLDALPWQVAHNDFNPHNLLVAVDDPDRVAGVIDFGDMVRTARIADVAVAASYLLRHPDGVGAAATFLRALEGEVALLAEERALLPDLMATRLAVAVTISEWRAARRPDQRDYILRNHPGAILGLDRLAAADPATFTRPPGETAEETRR